MTRLGHTLTTFTTLLTLAVTGSAFAQPAQTVTIPRVEIPSMEIPQVDIPPVHISRTQTITPWIEIPQIEIPALNFDLNLDKLTALQFDKFDNFEKFERFAELGRLAQTIDGKEVERLKADAMRDSLRDVAEKQREMAVRMRDNFGMQMQSPKRWERCNDRDADRLYDCGRDALDDKQYDRAVDYFGKVAAAKVERADAALYWKAYAQNRLGQRAEALATIAEFKAGYGKSRWANDVGMLEVDVRQHSGQPVKPGDATDDDVKLYALQALANNNSAEVVPMLEKLLTSTNSPRIKERALFVLAQTQTPTARALVIKVAKGGANPELQSRAVRYLGEINTPESRATLVEVYGATTDVEMKRNILRSYGNARDREHLLAAARQEQDPTLRLEAIRQLGNMRADDALSELYGRESNAEVKRQIIRALGNAGNADKLMSLAQSEQNDDLRRSAIRTLGNLRRTETGPRLTAMYEKEQNVDVRRAVIDALFIQNNATALVELARKEKNSDLKLELVKRLGNMKDKEAQDYLLELLK